MRVRACRGGGAPLFSYTQRPAHLCRGSVPYTGHSAEPLLSSACMFGAPRHKRTAKPAPMRLPATGVLAGRRHEKGRVVVGAAASPPDPERHTPPCSYTAVPRRGDPLQPSQKGLYPRRARSNGSDSGRCFSALYSLLTFSRAGDPSGEASPALLLALIHEVPRRRILGSTRRVQRC